MRKRLAVDQRGQIAEKVMELGNLAFGGLILGQALASRPFNFKLASIGVTGAIASYIAAIRLMKGGRK